MERQPDKINNMENISNENVIEQTGHGNNSEMPKTQEIFSINEWFNELPIRIIGTLQNPIFYASEIGIVLGIKNVRKSVAKFDESKVVTGLMRETLNIKSYKFSKNKKLIEDPTMILLTLSGAKRLIASSRSLIAQNLCNDIRYNFHKKVPELDFINKIQTIFSTEIFELQKCVLSYRIDLFMPKYNLAIEFDESHHKYQGEQDKSRENDIIAKIGCKFLRFIQSDDIYSAAGRIYAEIHKK